MLRHCLVVLAGLWCGGSAVAAPWADSLFDSLSKDFGSVARGATLTHLFRLTNKTNLNVHIAGFRTSCGCTAASALQYTLAPGEVGVVVVQMDTRRFSGLKNVTVYVHFDQPQIEEVRLWVQADSRDDVSVSPEGLTFGTIKRGSSPAAQVTITFLGAGAWQILDARCDSNYVQTNMQPVQPNGGPVAYQLTAQLRPDTPVGKWFTDVWLRTNQPAVPRVRVPLTVEIQSNLSLNPTAVALGEVKTGSRVERKVILSGVKPFKVVRFEGVGENVKVSDSATDSKPVHVLTIAFQAPEPGEARHSIRIVTDLDEDGEIELVAQAKIVP